MGSEMCIRDSPFIVSKLPFNNLKMSGNENKIPLEEPVEEVQDNPIPEANDRDNYMTNDPMTNNLESSFAR